MITRHHRLTVLLSLAFLAVPAAAQDPGTNKPCEERLRESQELLRQSENRVKDLIRENERLRRDIAEARAGGKSPPKPKSTGPAEPLTSPTALFEALVKDYNEKVGSLPRESKPEQVKYQGMAKRWAADATAGFRGPVEWQIKIVKIDPPGGAGGGRPADVTFQILDRAGEPAGEPFTQPIPGRFIKDLGTGIGSRIFKLTGTFGARPRFDAAAGDKAPDGARLIGPFVIFDCDLAVQNIVESK